MSAVSAGAVLYTVIQGQIRYLLVMEKKGHIGFPKGHLESGETEEQAALREIQEECGISATLYPNFRQELNYPVGGAPKSNAYFVARFQDQLPTLCATEVDGVLLVPYVQALKLLSHDNAKELLRSAAQWIDAHLAD